MPKKLLLGFGAGLFALLAACGGGGSGGGADAPSQIDRFAAVRDLVCSGAQNSGWCWQNPLPAGETVTTVVFLNENLGWVAGPRGWMQKTVDGGVTWSRLPFTGFDFLVTLAFADEQHGWALTTANDRVMRTADGGQTWQQLSLGAARPKGEFPGDDTLDNLWVIDAQKAVVIGSGSTSRGSFSYAMGTEDAGAHWRVFSATQSSKITPSGSILTLDASGGRRTDDLGLTSVALGPLPACSPVLDVVDDLNVWAYCSRPTSGSSGFDKPFVFQSQDGGLTWHDAQAVFPAVGSRDWTLSRVALSAQGVGLGVLTDNTGGVAQIKTLRATEGATSWSTVAQPASLAGATLPLNWVVDSQTLWLLKDGQAHWTEDGGTTWNLLSIPGEAGPPMRLKRDRAGKLLAEFFLFSLTTGSEGPTRHFYRSTDRGQTWRRVPGGLTETDVATTVRGLWFFDATRGLALAQDGGLMDTDNGGRNWLRRTSAVPPAACCKFTGRLQFTPGGRGWMINQGQLMQSSDSGRTWSLAPAPEAMNRLAELQFLGDQRGWAVAASGQLFATTDGGASWVLRPGIAGQLFRMVQFASDKVGVALVDDGVFFESVWRTADGGDTWQITNFNGRAQTGISRIHFADPSTVWMISGNQDGFTNHGLWRSSDGGATWAEVQVPGAGFLFDIHFVDAKRGWVVGAGMILSTLDGGVSWQGQAIGAASGFLTMFWLDGENGWVGGAGGTILATATGGR
ncbi:MAG TPA: YCF48-related protein [Ramlibacter sp.]|nr:YCF48-related protein [Ramlibacter sp.]